MSTSANPVGRPSRGPTRQVHLRIEDGLMLELYLLNPSLLAPNGDLRYGATNEYFIGLLQEDLARRRQALVRRAKL